MGTLLRTNEHPVERAVRGVLGIVLIGLAFTGTLGAWAYIGIVPLLTGVVGSCPLYSVLGVSTCPLRQSTSR